MAGDARNRAAAAQLAYRLRHAPHDEARAEGEETIELGQRLLKNLDSADGVDLEAQPGGPHHPARLLTRLESTLTGCYWLLDRERELKEHLEVAEMWVERDGYELVRLMGHYVGDLASEYKVAFVLLASECVAAEFRSKHDGAAMRRAMRLALNIPQQEADEENVAADSKQMESQRQPTERDRTTRLLASLVRLCEPGTDLLDGLPFDMLVPVSAMDARRRLAVVINSHIAHLEEMCARYRQTMAEDEAEAPSRLAFESGDEGQLQRRYLLSRERLFVTTINTFLKVRKASEAGEFDEIGPGPDETLDSTTAFDHEKAITTAKALASPEEFRSAEPSLALRPVLSDLPRASSRGVEGASIAPPATADGDGRATPADHGAVVAGPPRPQEIAETPEIAEKPVDGTANGEVCYVDTMILRNEPNASSETLRDEQERAVVAGTVPVPSGATEEAASAPLSAPVPCIDVVWPELEPRQSERDKILAKWGAKAFEEFQEKFTN